MEPTKFGSMGVGLGSSILGLQLGFDQSAQMRAETMEQVRRYMLTARHQESLAAAEGNASGVTSDSASLTTYLNTMSSEYAKQADWMKRAGEAKADALDESNEFKFLGSFASSVFSAGVG